MNQSIFYNYIYLDPRKPGQYCYEGLNFSLLYEPFYVGKGKHNKNYIYRKFYHQSITCLNRDTNKLKVNKVKKILSLGFNLKNFILQINDNISYDIANVIETLYIKTFGRIDNKTGSLTNLTDGGEGKQNVVTSDTTRLKMSIAMKKRHSDPNYIHPATGIKRPSYIIDILKDVSHCDKIYKGIENRDQNKENNPFYNKNHTDEYKLHLKNINMGLNNPMHWKYNFVSPTGETFEIIGKWRNFCKTHNLNERKIKQVFMLKLKEYEGWVVTLTKPTILN